MSIKFVYFANISLDALVWVKSNPLPIMGGIGVFGGHMGYLYFFTTLFLYLHAANPPTPGEQQNFFEDTEKTLSQVQLYTQNFMFDEALKDLKRIEGTRLSPLAWNNSKGRELYCRYQFYLLTNAFYLLDRDEAIKIGQSFSEYLTQLEGHLRSNPQLMPERNPENPLRSVGLNRYQVMTQIILEDLKKWGKRDLSEVSRLMKQSAQILDPNQFSPDPTSPPVDPKQKKVVEEKMEKLPRNIQSADKAQKKVIEILDELIKKEEDKKNNNNNPDQNPQGGDSNDPSQQPQEGNQSQAKNKPKKNQNDSMPGGEGGKGMVDEKKLRQYQENWGRLPEAERAKAIQDITRDVPAKFKPMIEAYFKALSRLPPPK